MSFTYTKVWFNSPMRYNVLFLDIHYSCDFTPNVTMGYNYTYRPFYSDGIMDLNQYLEKMNTTTRVIIIQ